MRKGLLYTDELTGFIRSRVTIVLVIGLPLLVAGLRLAQPNLEGISFFTFAAILIASVGGTLGSVLLSTSISSERARHVYELFLVRPVKRYQLLLAKYFAALTALLFTAIVALALAIGVDALAGRSVAGIVRVGIEPVVLSFAGMAIACSVGLLIGVLVDSLAVTAILSVYLGNQLSALVVVPAAIVPDLPMIPLAAAAGTIIPTIVIIVAIIVFRRKTL